MTYDELGDLETYLDWTEEDRLHLRIRDEEEGWESTLSLDELVEEVLDKGRIVGDPRELYCMAHELDRHANQVREAAEMMETDLDYVADLYDVDPEDLE